ncbi:hypothetical protein Tco_0721946 [Tanacetum coccineum]
MKQVVEDVGEDEDFNSGSWVGATEYVKANCGIVSGCLGDIKTFLKNGKLKQVVAIHQSLFSPNPSMYYLNITKKNVVKVFHKDFVPGNGSGIGGSGMLMEEEIFDEEALDLVLEEETRESRAHEEWLEKYRQQEEEDAKHERQLLGFHGTI